MAWCKLEDTFFDDPKFHRLGRLLNVHVHHARGVVASLWSWAVRVAPDGDLRQYETTDIEDAVRWDGQSGALVSALLAVQLLDQEESGLVLHRFLERAESHKAAQRQRKHREKDLSRNVTVTLQGPNMSQTLQRLEERDERRGEEREEREEKEAVPAPLAPLTVAAAVVAAPKITKRKESVPTGPIPELQGKHGSEHLAHVKHEVQRGWLATYPPSVVAHELAKAATWVAAKGVRKPNFGAFLTNWLSNANTSITKPSVTEHGGRAPVPSWEQTQARQKAQEERWAREAKEEQLAMAGSGTSLPPMSITNST